MVKFICDSSCDMLELPGVCFESVPLTISTGEQTWVDGPELDVKEMLSVLASWKGRSFTACPGVDAWLKAFEGADTIYAAAMTSTLSGTYNAAMAARAQYLADHPEAKIHVFDSLTTGCGLRLLMEKVAELHLSGLDFDEVCSRGDRYTRRTRLFFSFQSLHNFAQNGRVSKAVAAAVGMLGIRIVGTASSDGRLEPIARCRGDRVAMSELMRQLEQTGFHSGKLRVGHVENLGLAEKLAGRLAERYPEADISIYEAGGICSYYGEKGAIFLGAGT